MLSISVLIWLIRPLMSASGPEPSMIVVSSFVITTFLALPRRSIVAFSSLRPTSSLITWPPVRIAMSCNIAFRRSPKPGALTATLLKVPRILLTTNVAKASPSISSAIITSGRPPCITFSRIGNMSRTAVILFATSKMYGLSSDASMRSVSVAKYGEM
ncbi:unannotated protein [freshwater metagenome]|uniref:Unannotated protein n=1 Tax=freshwater metagenome TaxID=449393 RepID=A0A6J7UDW8_9ZZZZ